MVGAVRTVVVTGAAGVVGRRVVAAMAARDDIDRVVAIDRRPLAGSRPLPAGVEWRTADVAAERRGWGAMAVIHLAWEPAAGAGANLAALRGALVGAERAEVVVYVSSATVYGAWPDNPVPLREDMPIHPNPGFAYAAEKAEAERQLQDWRQAHPGVAVSILRPCPVVGSNPAPLYRALAGLGSPPPDDRRGPVQYVHVDDLAEAVMVAWRRPLTGVYNVAPDGGASEANARAIAGRLARLVGRAGWRLNGTGVPREAEPSVRYPWAVASDRLIAAGWRPCHTSEEALVAADPRSHIDDLPPGRRQELTLLIAGASTVAAGGVAAGTAVAWRRRSRRRQGARS
jgi:nucleoside-diphosphate-sugar epimerase